MALRNPAILKDTHLEISDPTVLKLVNPATSRALRRDMVSAAPVGPESLGVKMERPSPERQAKQQEAKRLKKAMVKGFQCQEKSSKQSNPTLAKRLYDSEGSMFPVKLPPTTGLRDPASLLQQPAA